MMMQVYVPTQINLPLGWPREWSYAYMSHLITQYRKRTIRNLFTKRPQIFDIDRSMGAD